jgi:hypothetical protein
MRSSQETMKNRKESSKHPQKPEKTCKKPVIKLYKTSRVHKNLLKTSKNQMRSVGRSGAKKLPRQRHSGKNLTSLLKKASIPLKMY